MLGNAKIDSMPAPGEVKGFFTLAGERKLVSAFIDHQYSIMKFHLDAGVLLNYSDVFGTGFYPGLDAGSYLADAVYHDLREMLEARAPYRSTYLLSNRL